MTFLYLLVRPWSETRQKTFSRQGASNPRIHAEYLEIPPFRLESGTGAKRSTLLVVRVSANFDVERDDGLGSQRNLLGVTPYEDL